MPHPTFKENQRAKERAKTKQPKTRPLEQFRSLWPEPFKVTTTIVKAFDQATTRAPAALILKGTAKFKAESADDPDTHPGTPEKFLEENDWALWLNDGEAKSIGYCDMCNRIIPQQDHDLEQH